MISTFEICDSERNSPVSLLVVVLLEVDTQVCQSIGERDGVVIGVRVLLVYEPVVVPADRRPVVWAGVRVARDVRRGNRRPARKERWDQGRGGQEQGEGNANRGPSGT